MNQLHIHEKPPSKKPKLQQLWNFNRCQHVGAASSRTESFFNKKSIKPDVISQSTTKMTTKKIQSTTQIRIDQY